MDQNLEEVLTRIAVAIERLNVSVLELGWKDAIAPHGAIESLGMLVRDGFREVVDEIAKQP